MKRRQQPARVYPDLAAYLSDHPDISQGDIARELGVSQAWVSMVLSGQRQPRLAMALKMTRLYNIPLESLIAKAS